METTTFIMPNISCDHCVRTLKQEISALEGVLNVQGDASKKELVVEWTQPASIEKIKNVLETAGYPAAS